MSQRPSASQRGYDVVWRRFRRWFLSRHPICAHCGRPAQEVDHKTPLSKGGARLDPDNCQSLCKPCHSRKTAADRGKFSLSGIWKVPNIKPSRIPVTMVCGPPGAGKSTYAKKNAGLNDLVIDLDDIRARVSGTGKYKADNQWLAPAIIERNRMLGRLANDKKHHRAWFVLSGGKAYERKRWAKALGDVEIKVLAVDADTCIARIAKDRERTMSLDEYERIIDRWWRDYSKPMAGLGRGVNAGGVPTDPMHPWNQ